MFADQPPRSNDPEIQDGQAPKGANSATQMTQEAQNMASPSHGGMFDCSTEPFTEYEHAPQELWALQYFQIYCIIQYVLI